MHTKVYYTSMYAMQRRHTSHAHIQGHHNNTVHARQLYALILFHFQYENEGRLIAGPWSSNLSRVPHWSDAKGKVSLPQEAFIPPEGWRWDGPWELSPEIR